MSELKPFEGKPPASAEEGATVHETLVLILRELRTASRQYRRLAVDGDLARFVGETAAQTAERIGVPAVRDVLSRASSELRR